MLFIKAVRLKPICWTESDLDTNGRKATTIELMEKIRDQTGHRFCRPAAQGWTAEPS